jgi:hypothetical protein
MQLQIKRCDRARLTKSFGLQERLALMSLLLSSEF